MKRFKKSDYYFKKIYKHARYMRDLCEIAFSAEELKVWDIDTLAPKTPGFIDKKQAERRADLFFSIKQKNTDKQATIALLVEHKSFQDKNLLFQLLSYLACFYEKEKSPLIPLVFYHGRNPKWNIPMDFHGVLGVSSLCRKYVPNFTYKLINIHNLDIPRQTRHLTSCVVLLIFQKSHRDFPKKDQREFFKLLHGLSRKERFRLGEILMGFIGNCHPDLSLEQLASAEQEVIKGKEDCFMEKFKNFYVEQAEERGMEKGREEGMEKGREEGMEKGREEGMKKERKTMALKLLQEGMEISFVSKVSGLTIEEIKSLED
ncbi:MAG: Rpn family recombination-promoting nuclease/putative transposase [Halobacteriovoraceae bacterium]|nr:Rpn family recombination-promoting nuclease/putative transposase [Halobacteriovoraceae bacterium]